jgi:hypothetical protein
MRGFLLFFLIFSALGCRSLKQGDFAGTLQISSPNLKVNQPVHIHIRKMESHQKLIDIQGEKKELLGQVRIDKASPWSFLLTISSVSSEPFLLKKTSSRSRLGNESCFAHEGDWLVQFCFSEDQFYLQAKSDPLEKQFLIYGSMSKEGSFTLEEPFDVSLEEGVTMALDGNFVSRESFAVAYQAKQQATAAYLNLLPHLNVGLLWYASPTPYSAASGIVNVAPFLLPTRWLDAKRASLESRVQFKALGIVKANLIVTIESLFYEFSRLQNILKLSDSFLEVIGRFDGVNVNTPSRDALVRNRESLQKTIEQTQWLLEKTRYALSLALGLKNPQAVQKISLGDLEEPSAKSVIDGESLGKEALKRSIELSQLDLILESQQTRTAWLYFNWIDPSGDYNSALGVNLFYQSKVIQWKLTEIKIKQEEMRANIFNRAYGVALNHNTAMKGFLSAQTKARNSEDDFSKAVIDLLGGLSQEIPRNNVQIEPFIRSLENWMNATFESEDQLRNYRIERANFKRLILSGNYSNLLF